MVEGQSDHQQETWGRIEKAAREWPVILCVVQVSSLKEKEGTRGTIPEEF